MKRLLKAIAKLTLVLLVVIGLVIAVMLYVMSRSDKEHARFYATGKSVNTFLGSYKHGIEEAFKKKDANEIVKLYADDFNSPARGRWVMQNAPNENDVAVMKLVREGNQDFTKVNMTDEVKGYLDSIAEIKSIWCKIDMIEQIEPEKRVTLRVKYILTGKDKQNAAFEDRHFYRWTLVNTAAAGGFDWKITKDELIEGLRVAGNGQSFKDVAPESIGIDFKHSRDPKLNAEKYGDKMMFDIIEHGSGGVSAVDYDNDGQADIFFPDGVSSRLYKNIRDNKTGDVKFEDVTTKAGLEGIDQSNAGIFADVDNDGDKDLFVARYLTSNKFFINNGNGTFTDQSKEFGLDLNSTSVTACFLDYDRDGYVDLYVGLYGDAVNTIPRLPFFGQNANPNRLYHNEGGKKFVDVTERSGVGDTGWSLAVAAADYNNDGLPDIAVANDFGRKCLFRNNGDGTFTDVAKEAGVLDFSGGMGLTFGDFNDDGKVDLYTSNINSNQRWFGEDETVNQYIRNVARTRWLLLDAKDYWKFYKLVGSEWSSIGTQIGEGNSLFQNKGDGTFEEIKNSNAVRAGWGWSVLFFDVDNDTDLDIYAANGWITNKNKDDL
jgi:hypothetical protein